MNINSKRISIIVDIVIVILIVALGIVVRLPDENTVGSAQLDNELTDQDCFYLSDPDSYLYARKAREYSVDLSRFSFINTRTEDYMMSPVSSKENGLVTNGLPLLATLIFRLLSLFSDITIEMAIYYINVVICALAAVPAYFYVRKQTNLFGGIVSAILAVTAIPFLEHSVAGYFDTDAMLATIPLCLVCCFALMVEENNTKPKVVYGVLSVLSFAILASTWETFYIYFGILVFLSVITIIQLKLVRGSDGALTGAEIWHEAVYMISALAGMALIASLMYGSTIVDSVRRLATNMLVTNSYPDPTKYIVELSEIPVLDNGLEGAFFTTGSGMINKLGGVVVLAMAIVAIVLIILMRKRFEVKAVACNIGIIAVWFLVTLPLLIAGVRFLQLVCLPLALLVGLGVGIISELTAVLTGKKIGIVASVFACALVLFGPLVGTSLRKNTPSPFYNKTFDEACTWINNYASENADILTWWDYGYFIQFASARHVLADGGTFDGRYFYWLGHALLTDDPNLSVAIFNMLDFSGVDSSDVAEEYLGSADIACEALLKVLTMSKEDGIKLLTTKYMLDESEATEIVNVAKPDVKDERYLIISRDLIAKIGALAYYGMYDFNREDYNVSLGVSSAPVKVSVFGETTAIRGIDDINVVIKTEGGNDYVTLVDNDGNLIDISRIIYVERGAKVRDEHKGDNGYTLYCINDNREYSFIVCSNNIADSMLVSLMAYDSNEAYTKVAVSVLGDNLISSDSVTARFFGNSSTPENAGVYVYKAIK